MMAKRERMVGGGDARIARDILVIVGCSLAVALLLKTFLVGAFLVRSRSMENSLFPGDFVLVNRLAYGLRVPRCALLVPSWLTGRGLVRLSSPRRGDIIAFEGMGSDCPTPTLLKRCVALPGDTLQFQGGRLRVNGAVADLPGVAHGAPRWSCVLPRAGEEIELTATTAGLLRPLIEDEGHSLVTDHDGVVHVDGRITRTYEVSQDAYFVLGDNHSSSLDSRSFGVVPAGRVIGKAFLVYWSRSELREGSGFENPLAGVRWTRIGMLLE